MIKATYHETAYDLNIALAALILHPYGGDLNVNPYFRNIINYLKLLDK